MSIKSNQGSLNTSLGKLTINNSYDANTNTAANPFVLDETIITPTFISVNGNIVNTAKIASTIYGGLDVPVPANNTSYIIIDGEDFQYTFSQTPETVPTWSFTCNNSYIYVSTVVFNYATNQVTITFVNNSDDDGLVGIFYINFYTAPY